MNHKLTLGCETGTESDQGGHAQVKVKFPMFSLCLQFFPVFLRAKIKHINL